MAQAHLTLGDAPAAIEWIEDCLTIARGAYPYLEAEALLTLAAARRGTSHAVAATNAAEQAASIAATCGFRLLEVQATTTPPRP